jgi:hypothetical protein
MPDNPLAPSLVQIALLLNIALYILGKKNMLTIFRLGARAISTCLVLLAAT